jgi:GWxTD domain-containing protein
MRARSQQLVFLGGLLLVSPGIASAQKLDKDDKAFLDAVRPILLSEEEKLFKGLKDKSDRLEFQKIFWARRDPDLSTPANEYQAQFQKSRDEADRLYRMPAQAGSFTDCGRVYILLGKPDEVLPQAGNIAPGLRAPEVWVYKDKEGRSYVGGKTQIAFDEECRAAAALAPQLDRVAAAHVVQPNLEYKRTRTATSSSWPTCCRRTRRRARC